MNKYVTIKEASEILSTNPQKIKKLISIGRIKALDISAGEGKRSVYRIPEDEINKLVIERK